MEDGNCAFGTFSEIGMDLDSMDELLFNGCWLETSDATNFMQPPRPSTSCFASAPRTHHLGLNSHRILEKETEGKFPPSSSLKLEEFDGKTSTDEEASVTATSLTQSGSFSFLLQGSESGSRRCWIGPRTNAHPDSSTVKDRLVYAIGYLQELMEERDFLIQIWVPVKRGSRKVLTTEEQPYSFNPGNASLARYRDVSKAYSFAAEADSGELVGLPGRVFLRKLPEWTPDVRFFRRDEYPRLSYARQYDVRGSLALPVLERRSGTCLGVLEIVTTMQKTNYRPELHNICRALEAVDLRSSHNLIPPSKNKAYPELHQETASSEVASVLESVCRSHNLPLALTWASCVQPNRVGSKPSCCLSTVDSACFVTDEDSRSFFSACSEHHLLPGEGTVGRAFATNKQCFVTDVTIFSKTNYPLSHHARMFGYHAALAIPLRSKHSATGPVELVLELFFPKDCVDAETQKQTLNSLATAMRQRLQSSHLVMDKELEEEVIFPVGETPPAAASAQNSDDYQEKQKLRHEESAWISHMMEPNRRGKGVALSWEYQKEEPIEEEFFKVTASQWESSRIYGTGESSSCIYPLASSEKTIETRKRKGEKAITLEVLRKHFAGSLKDAAKSIGVCPTTLKRICRQHGISRWPSRKIKKVGHSLRKLQIVMDSVQGVQGSVQLSSFYSSFPELNSPNLSASLTHFDVNSHSKQSKSEPKSGGAFNHATLAPKSPPSSSGSQSSSGTSTCCSTGTNKSHAVDVNASKTEGTAGLWRRARSQPQLLSLSLEEPNDLLARSNQRVVGETSLPPLPAKSTGKEAIKVKATFGESKVRLSLQRSWGFKDLRKEIAKRFAVDISSNFDLKYLDDDREWVLLTCDADLEECIDIYRSSQSRTIKISVHHSPHWKQG